MRTVRSHLPTALLILLILWGGWYVYDRWQNLPQTELRPISLKEKIFMPVMIRELPGHSGFAIAEKEGRLGWFKKGATTWGGLMLDISSVTYSLGYEEGFLGFAFDPNFSQNRRLFIFYSMQNPLRSRLSRFEVADNWRVDKSSEVILFEVPKVQESHNGGMLEFGKDGYLYVSVGEGHFPDRQTIDKVLSVRDNFYGSILRLDVSTSSKEKPYSIPPDNPLAKESAPLKGEVWASGFRNVWRFSFDRDTGDLYGNDVGGIKFEEINRVERGKNYGWPIMEGENCHYSTDHGRCDRTNKELPLVAMSHKDGFDCITGGYVYRGKRMPELYGQYIFSILSGGIFRYDLASEKMQRLHPPSNIVSMGEDAEGELFVVSYSGEIYELWPLQQEKSWAAFWQSFFQQTPAERKALIAKGQKLYENRNCRTCHGDVHETTTNPAYPRLWGQNAEYVVNQLKDFQSGARTNSLGILMRDMVKDMTQEEMRALALFVESKRP